MKKTFKLLQLLNNSKYIKRAGPNLFAGVDNRDIESISEHSYKVAYLTLLFSDRVKGIDKYNVLKYSLMHDWAECVIGDIPSGSPSYQSYFDVDIRGIFKKAEDNVFATIKEDTNIELPSLSENERELISFADSLASILEMVDLRQKGYHHRWINKMYKVSLDKLNKFRFDFVPDVISEVEELFAKGRMDNTYLTRETD